VSWQIIPRRLTELLSGSDGEVARRATEAMMSMRKIDIAALEAAVS
jgi:2-polyprenyl-6-hydroxyphenyl methylase/3-demethylubiquinone-9 3-methyltransferase